MNNKVSCGIYFKIEEGNTFCFTILTTPEMYKAGFEI